MTKKIAMPCGIPVNTAAETIVPLSRRPISALPFTAFASVEDFRPRPGAQEVIAPQEAS
jgi:hypothetical protein